MVEPIRSSQFIEGYCVFMRHVHRIVHLTCTIQFASNLGQGILNSSYKMQLTKSIVREGLAYYSFFHGNSKLYIETTVV